MKYFTPELLARFESLDEDVDAAVFEEVHEQWEHALQRYRRRMKRILPTLPKRVQQFRQDHVCLHDAQLLSMGRRDGTLLMLLEPEPPSPDVVTLTFHLEEEPAIQHSVLAEGAEREFVTWMYEEWDVDRNKKCRLEVLFSNGWVVKLCFRDFDYQIAQRLFPAPKRAGEPARLPQAVLPQSA